MTQRRNRTDDERNRLIRHHLEEVSTHLTALKQLIGDSNHSEKANEHYKKQLSRIGTYLKQLYVRHGGIEH